MTCKLFANDTVQRSGIILCGKDMIRVLLRLSLNRQLAKNYKTSQTSNISLGTHGPKHTCFHVQR